MVKDKSERGYLYILISLIKEVGLPGSIFVVLAFVFIVWGTVEQKQYFIDKYILLRGVSSDPKYCILVVIVLLSLLILGSFYCNRSLKQGLKERNRIGEQKTKIQEKALNKNLNSSN